MVVNWQFLKDDVTDGLNVIAPNPLPAAMAAGNEMAPQPWLAWLLIDGNRVTDMTLAIDCSDTVIPERA